MIKLKNYFGLIAVSALLILLVVLALRETGTEGDLPHTRPQTPDSVPASETKETATVETLPETQPVTEEAPAALVLPRFIFFADNGGGVPYEEISGFTSPWTRDQDVGSFGVVPVVTPEGKASYLSLWTAAKALYPDVAACKLGYLLHFELENGEKFDIDLLSPADALGDFNVYLDAYLYDDVAGTGSWYSHLTENDFTESSLITSVKITGREKVDQVTAISLSAYLYRADGVRSDALTLNLTKK